MRLSVIVVSVVSIASLTVAAIGAVWTKLARLLDSEGRVPTGDPLGDSAAIVGGDALLAAARLGGICAAVIGLQYFVAGLDLLSRVGKINVKRMVQHVSSGVLILFLFLVLPQRMSELALGVAVGAFLLLQVARLSSQELNTQFLVAFGPMLKEDERNGIRPPGAFYFLLGCFLSTACLPRRLAVFAMLSVTLGDPLAALGGAAFGGPRILGSKTLGGFLTCCLAGAVAGLSVLLLFPKGGQEFESVTLQILSALICAAATGFGELVGGHLTFLDDNLTASFGSGLVVMAVHKTGLISLGLC